MTTDDQEDVPREVHSQRGPSASTAVRLFIGVGVAVGIFVLFMLSVNVLNSWGVWVTLLLISVITASALALWVRDAIKHPATSFDDESYETKATARWDRRRGNRPRP